MPQHFVDNRVRLYHSVLELFLRSLLAGLPFWFSFIADANLRIIFYHILLNTNQKNTSILYRVGGTCRVYRLHYSIGYTLLLPTP
jgi:hypothetical protein